MAAKTFVLSDDVILSSDACLLAFGEDNNIVIPLCILDRLRRYKGIYEKERTANKVLDYIADLPKEKYDLKKGTIQVNGSKLFIASNYKDITISEVEGLEPHELRILQTCKGISEKCGKVILISRNAVLRMKAEILGITAQDFEEKVFPRISEQYTGRRDVEVDYSVILKLRKQRQIPISEIITAQNLKDLIPNEFLRFTCNRDELLARFDHATNMAVWLEIEQSNNKNGTVKMLNSAQGKNSGQKFAIEALMQPSKVAPLVVIKGSAGTGKTYCSLKVAINKQEANEYQKIYVAAPCKTVGQENQGALPGDIDLKYQPYLGGVFSNLEAIVSEKLGKNVLRDSEAFQRFCEERCIKIQPLGFLRGENIDNTFFIVDEAQNIDPVVIKSIVTRAAAHTKIVFIGDSTQIDDINLNERYNGLVYLSESMKGDPLCWQVAFDNDEESILRGPLAYSAVKRLCK